MKPAKGLAAIILALAVTLPACQEETEQDEYKTVSELISERNRARYEKRQESSPQSSPRKLTAKRKTLPPETGISGEDELSSIILYEEKVKIVGAESGRALAKGVAYINKKGQIVRIKIVKE